MLRIYFGGFGWGGPKLQVTLDELKNDNDVITEASDIKIAYDSELEAYVNGTIIDYSNSWFNRGFSIRGGYLSSC
jgi:Fe-S cluster assembly iron-binding protein IscA